MGCAPCHFDTFSDDYNTLLISFFFGTKDMCIRSSSHATGDNGRLYRKLDQGHAAEMHACVSLSLCKVERLVKR